MSIEGLDSLNRKLGALADRVIEQEMEKAVGRQTKMVQGKAKLLCPVNDGELRNSIKTMVERREDRITGIVYTNKKHAPYVEFGTGPKGEADHSGIAPNIAVAYSQKPWWIHESQVDKETAEQYHWFKIETSDGIFYQCTGQAAQPYMYPALKDNEKTAVKNMGQYLAKKIREEAKK